MNNDSDRDKLLQYLEKQLTGPAGDDGRISLTDRPYERYTLGAIFPKGSSKKKADTVDEEDATAGAADESENPVGMAYEFMPSSVGLSFVTSSTHVKVAIAAAHYTDGDPAIDRKKRAWIRTELASRKEPLEVDISRTNKSATGILEGHADLLSVWRPLNNGFLVTVSLVNARKARNDGRFDAGEVLHQIWLSCTPVEGRIESYPAPNRYSWDKEEEELALIYRNRKTFGLGHGCAAHWDVTTKEYVESIQTAFIPRHEIPPVTSSLPDNHPLKDSPVFTIQYLAAPETTTAFSKKHILLSGFIAEYQNWITEQIEANDIPQSLQNAADRIAGKLNEAVIRMKKGLDLLERNQTAQKCFTLANKAMLLQMIHAGDEDYALTEKEYGAQYRFKTSEPFSKKHARFKWHPFQLAFQLLIIESLANRNSEDRNVLDLIWFPTGGGKTEAYLAVAAFEMFYRRMQFGDAGGGTAIITRYTLRLLTVQQFERTAALICACEKIRREHTGDLGDEPFSLGLWVGDSNAPNKLTDAHDKFLELREQEKPENPFLLRKCPWCGTRLIPEQHSGRAAYGIRSDANSFEFFCPAESCEFHDLIPVNVIDEHLYRTPPTMLAATIDKFARPAWTEGPHSFFTGGPQGIRQPPSLIIQDELHLISGPLGTIAGLYEAALDVCMRNAGGTPKYIAATATIRRAKEQVKRLYARDAVIFPPSGNSFEDSFFSREDTTKTGRIYAGILSQYHTPATSYIHASAALAQGVQELDLTDAGRDAYWTQVLFHNSKKELGKTMTRCRDDIPGRINVIAGTNTSARTGLEVVEMSANISAREIPDILNRLKAKKGSGNEIDFLPCTNMFSVGVDIPRLGLVMINGQPKTTAEYIQVSSRVGRGQDVDGLVIALYPNSKARDRSLYESFIPYHQSLYRAVEPTSVTPYSEPAMARALHAAIVIVMRLCGGLPGNEDARRFNSRDPQSIQLLDRLRHRMHAAAEENSEVPPELDQLFDKCIGLWQSKVNMHNNNLVYDAAGAPNLTPLIKTFEPGVYPRSEIPWQTLNSMRNVDQECKVHVRGEKING